MVTIQQGAAIVGAKRTNRRYVIHILQFVDKPEAKPITLSQTTHLLVHPGTKRASATRETRG